MSRPIKQRKAVQVPNLVEYHKEFLDSLLSEENDALGAGNLNSLAKDRVDESKLFSNKVAINTSELRKERIRLALHEISSFFNDESFKVYGEINAMVQNQKSQHKDMELETSKVLNKLCKMEQDIDGILRRLMSGSRPMTITEKHNLGKLLREIPQEAFGRVFEILGARKGSSDQANVVKVDLEQLDDATLWRLYYLTEMVLKPDSRC